MKNNMKKIYSLIALVLGATAGDIAVAAPDNVRTEVAINTADLFDFADESFDATTAFLDLSDGSENSFDNSPSANVDTDELISFAKQYLGRPYVHGSKGPKAFDCSGFTSFVFKNFNISLSPSSKAQATQGFSVSREDVKAGDILVFQGRSGRSVGHVAIAIDVDDSGDITFIHAATGGVRIDKMSKMAYYQKRYLGARRVIN